MKNKKYGNIELNQKYSHISINSYILSFQNKNLKEMIPLVKLTNDRAYQFKSFLKKKKKLKNNFFIYKDFLIIYSHGNASDLVFFNIFFLKKIIFKIKLKKFREKVVP